MVWSCRRWGWPRWVCGRMPETRLGTVLVVDPSVWRRMAPTLAAALAVQSTPVERSAALAATWCGCPPLAANGSAASLSSCQTDTAPHLRQSRAAEVSGALEERSVQREAAACWWLGSCHCTVVLQSAWVQRSLARPWLVDASGERSVPRGWARSCSLAEACSLAVFLRHRVALLSEQERRSPEQPWSACLSAEQSALRGSAAC